MLKHQTEWSSDRNEALLIRRSVYHNDESDRCYECDDKCGSFWQQLPVNATGRYTKQDVTQVFKFSVQANVLSGKGKSSTILKYQ